MTTDLGAFGGSSNVYDQYRGLHFCWRCGDMDSQRLRLLAKPCEPSTRSVALSSGTWCGSHRCCRTVWLDGPMRGTNNAVPIEKDLQDEEEYVGVAATCHCSWRVDIIRWFSQAIIPASRICLLLHFQRRRREPDVGSVRFQIAVVDWAF